MLTLTRVTGQVSLPDGSPKDGARVQWILSRAETDGAIVVPIVTETVADGGEIDINVWPNARGSGGSHYTVRVFDDRLRSGFLDLKAYVPDTGTAQLEQILQMVPPESIDDAQQAVIDAQDAATRAENAAALETPEGYTNIVWPTGENP